MPRLDYKKGFGGQFGVQSDRVDKSAVGWDKEKQEGQPQGEKERANAAQVTKGAANSLRNKFEQLAMQGDQQVCIEHSQKL